jgi:hypothetical protein
MQQSLYEGLAFALYDHADCAVRDLSQDTFG